MEHICARLVKFLSISKAAVHEDIVKRFLEITLSKVFDRLAMTCTNCHNNLLEILPKVTISKLGQGNTPENWRNVDTRCPKVEQKLNNM